MFSRSFKTFSSLPFQSRSLLKLRSPFLRSFSTLTSQNPQEQNPNDESIQEAKMVEFLTRSDSHINDYMKHMNKYLLGASIMGISTASLLAVAAPVGFPSAFLILGGFAMEHNGSEYIQKTKPQVYTYKDKEGNIHYSTKNTFRRKLAFVSTCVGYGCILGSMMSIIPVATAVLPLSAVGCLFSTIGHFTYAKYAPKPYFNTIQLFVSGLLTGIVGVNLAMAGSALFMLEGALTLQNVEFSTYIGLLLYNAFAGHDSQKALEDVHAGKGDYLKHAGKFSENWLYALVPHFLMSLS